MGKLIRYLLLFVKSFNICYVAVADMHRARKLLRQGYRYHNFRKAFSKFYRRHIDIASKYNVGLKHFFCKAFRNLNFMATWCFNSEK